MPNRVPTLRPRRRQLRLIAALATALLLLPSTASAGPEPSLDVGLVDTGIRSRTQDFDLTVDAADLPGPVRWRLTVTGDDGPVSTSILVDATGDGSSEWVTLTDGVGTFGPDAGLTVTEVNDRSPLSFVTHLTSGSTYALELAVIDAADGTAYASDSVTLSVPSVTATLADADLGYDGQTVTIATAVDHVPADAAVRWRVGLYRDDHAVRLSAKGPGDPVTATVGYETGDGTLGTFEIVDGQGWFGPPEGFPASAADGQTVFHTSLPAGAYTLILDLVDVVTNYSYGRDTITLTVPEPSARVTLTLTEGTVTTGSQRFTITTLLDHVADEDLVRWQLDVSRDGAPVTATVGYDTGGEQASFDIIDGTGAFGPAGGFPAAVADGAETTFTTALPAGSYVLELTLTSPDGTHHYASDTATLTVPELTTSPSLPPRPPASPDQPPVPPRPDFDDVPQSNVHAEAIARLVRRGVATGTSETTFDPSGALLRDQMAAFLLRLTNLTDGDTEPEEDVDAAFTRMVEAGLFRGYDDGTLRPRDPLTRAQAASVLAALVEGITGDQLPTGGTVYPDVTGATHADNIAKLTHLGIFVGYPDGRFGPDDRLRRDQMASVLLRVIDHLTATGHIDDVAS